MINVEDLENPSNVQEYLGRTTAIHHNLYVAEHQGTDYIYQANYRAGLQILKVIDWETADFVEAGHFDTYPADDLNDFGGAWSVYPFFRSGLLAVSSIEEGLFLVRSSELKYEAPTAQPTTSPTTRPQVTCPETRSHASLSKRTSPRTPRPTALEAPRSRPRPSCSSSASSREQAVAPPPSAGVR